MTPTPAITRLPFPQTVQSARTYILSHGLNISEMARANGLRPPFVIREGQSLKLIGCG